MKKGARISSCTTDSNIPSTVDKDIQVKKVTFAEQNMVNELIESKLPYKSKQIDGSKV